MDSKQKVGDYEFDKKEDKIGEGTFGKVFRAKHFQRQNSKAAIKTINLSKYSVRNVPPDVLGRELKILEAIPAASHINLVSLLFCESTTTKIYLVMEFCNGGDFLDYLKVQKTLSEAVIKQFFRQIVAGLKFLHDKNIIHRDLKPANILLTFDGGRYPEPRNITLKIADFGLGRFLPPDGKADTYCGTYAYMAPEIHRHETYDKKVDMWSIGVMIYECLVGKIIDPDFNNFELPANASQEISQLLLTLLSQKAQDRYDCDQLLAHGFTSGHIIQLFVRDNQGSRQITMKSNSSVDAVIEKVRETFDLRIESDSILLFSQGSRLEHSSGSSLEDHGISGGSTLDLCYQLPGGRYTTIEGV